MKRFLIAVLLTITAVSASAQAGKAIYNRYSDNEGISAVYISPAMFRLIGKIPDLNVGDESVNLTPLIRSLSGLYIISGPLGAVGEDLQRDVAKMVKAGGYELLMEAKDSGETVKMYSTGTEKIVKGFVMSALDGDECTFICLDGEMPRDEFEKLVASLPRTRRRTDLRSHLSRFPSAQ